MTADDSSIHDELTMAIMECPGEEIRANLAAHGLPVSESLHSNASALAERMLDGPTPVDI